MRWSAPGAEPLRGVLCELTRFVRPSTALSSLVL